MTSDEIMRRLVTEFFKPSNGDTQMRYRSDESHTQPDGAVLWYAKWMGGPSLAKIENCRLEKLAGDMRRTVAITGEPDTAFSQPAECSIAGAKVRGYVTGDDEGNLVFRHVYYDRPQREPKTQTCYFTFSHGLRGLYMPDSHSGAYAVTRRKDLADAIRSELEMHDAPACRFATVGIKRLWSQAKRSGTSSIHFSIDTTDGYALNFHGLTQAEYEEIEAQND